MQIILLILNGFEYQPKLSVFALEEIPLYNQKVIQWIQRVALIKGCGVEARFRP